MTDNKNDRKSTPLSPADQVVEQMHRRSLRQRLSNVRTTRWVRFAIVSVIFFLWVMWMNNAWLLFLWIILADIYLTCYIPWNWWKHTRNKALRTVMNWVDAIVYALILVYFIFAFVGQNYKIPSSSLEKSLLVGDYLWVNKMIYGPRVPQTPVHFPLTQHTFPVINTPSYLRSPSLPYHRLKGFRSVERGDIVVFNYPQGDTVPSLIDPAQGDYYQICATLRGAGIADPRDYILRNPDQFGKLVWRPVDRRENYVKRAIGLPGERIKIVDDVVYINGSPIPEPDNVQYKYAVPARTVIPEERWLELGVRRENLGIAAELTQLPQYQGKIMYNIPLTASMKAEVEKWPEVSGPLVKESHLGAYNLGGVFPLGNRYGWTRPYMGEFWIPKRGATLRLTLNNLPIYERAIRTYEGNSLEVRDGKIYINGRQTDRYTFRMDYYWMMGDNRDWSADSRYWGFVPEDHIVGSPMFVLVSFDEDRSWTDGKMRWSRIGHPANPDKEKFAR